MGSQLEVVNDNSVVATANVNVTDMLGMMDVVDALRRQREEVSKQLSHDEQVDDLKDRLRKTYEGMGVQVDDFTLARAIKDHFSQKYEFIPPKHDFSYTLANWYVDRVRLGKKFGIPAAIALALGVGGWVAKEAVTIAYEKHQESVTEAAVEEAYRTSNDLERKIDLALSGVPGHFPTGERMGVSRSLEQSHSNLRDVKLFFMQYAPTGDAKDQVTPENYVTVDTQLKVVMDNLDHVAISQIEVTRRATQHGQEEQAVERGVEQRYRERESLEKSIDSLTVSPLVSQLPRTEQDEVKAFIQQAQQQVKTTDTFFAAYYGQGAVAEKVTLDNYTTVQAELNVVIDTLAKISHGLSQENGLLKQQQTLNQMRQQLEVTIADLRDDHIPHAFGERSETAYRSGLKALEERQVDSAKSALGELAALKQNAVQYATLVQDMQQIYTSVKQIAKENTAVQEINRIYGEAQAHIQSLDTAQLRKDIQELGNLDTVLKQEYDIVIVTRGGVKSGIDRYFTDENGRIASGYYLIVEAVDHTGTIYPMDIKSAEDGKTERVRMWGEQVSQAVFEEVKQDKKDDGIISDTHIGTKHRGYITPQNERKFKLVGKQITHW